MFVCLITSLNLCLQIDGSHFFQIPGIRDRSSKRLVFHPQQRGQHQGIGHQKRRSAAPWSFAIPDRKMSGVLELLEFGSVKRKRKNNSLSFPRELKPFGRFEAWPWQAPMWLHLAGDLEQHQRQVQP